MGTNISNLNTKGAIYYKKLEFYAILSLRKLNLTLTCKSKFRMKE